MSRGVWPDDFAAWQERVDRELAELAGSTRLGQSSIESGTLEIYQDDSFRGAVGLQPDGTVTIIEVNAPAPPAPSAPILRPTAGGWASTWDGRNADGGNVWPLDFLALDVHASTDLLFEPVTSPDSTTIIGQINTTLGGMVMHSAPDYSTYAVRFVARNRSGVPSAPSVAVTVTPGQLSDLDIADFSLTVRKFFDSNHHIY